MNGVNVIGIPLAADQFDQAFIFESKNLVRVIESNEVFTHKKLNEYIEESQQEGSEWDKNTLKMQKEFLWHIKNSPTFESWLDYLHEFGVDHLQPNYHNIPWWKYYCLHVILPILFALWVIYRAIKWVICKCCGKKAPIADDQVTDDKKNN